MFNNSNQTFLLQKVSFIQAATDRPLCECHTDAKTDIPVSFYLCYKTDLNFFISLQWENLA